MSRQLNNLQRLCAKLQTRYGEEDDLVMQLKLELESLAAAEAQHKALVNQGRRKQDQVSPPVTVH